MSSYLIPATLPATQGLSPCYQPTSPVYSLDDLIADIKQHLGCSSGIGSSDIDTDYLISLVQKYNSNPTDWARFYYNNPGKNYTRNAIENINHKANILLLVWNPGKGSPIHNHADAHCIMKILAGELAETVYHPQDTDGDKTRPLRLKHCNTLGMNGVTYISDELGLHRVHNPSSHEIAVSLHLYTPPNAADYGYHIFDEATGKASFVPQAQSYSTTSSEKPLSQD